MAGIIGGVVSAVGGIAGAASGGSGGGGFFSPSTPPSVPTTYSQTTTLPDWYTADQQGALQGIRDISPDVTALIQQGAQQLTKTTNPGLDAGTFASYMDPYTSAVTDNIARLGNENLMENVLPGVNDTFTGAGQFGGNRNAEFEERAIRNNQREISGAQANALEAGFNTSLNAYNAGENRAQAAVPLYTQLALSELQPSIAQANVINGMKVPTSVSGVTSGPLPGAGYGPSPAAGLASAASGLIDPITKLINGNGSGGGGGAAGVGPDSIPVVGTIAHGGPIRVRHGVLTNPHRGVGALHHARKTA